MPAGGMQMPCRLIRDISERAAVDCARKADIDLLGLTQLHASNPLQAGFLMGFAAHTPHEPGSRCQKLASVLRTLGP